MPQERILIATVATLLTSAILLGVVGIIRWRGSQALRSDTRSVIAQTAQQLVRALQSRRGTLTFLRDVLEQRSNLTPPQLQAMGSSAALHTRHLVGIGLAQRAQPPLTWWWLQPRLSEPARVQLRRAILQRSRLRSAWRVPSTFTVMGPGHRPLLMMLEPLRTNPASRAVIGVLDVEPLLNDFFKTFLPQPHPVQLLDDSTLLYRSGDWRAPSGSHRPLLIEQPLTLDTMRWVMRMQPGHTPVVQTLSWFKLLLIGLSILTALGVTVIVWILAARAWLLQRAVARRTAALRRTSRRLRQMAITDELTGVYNRRFFLDRWEWECARARRYQRPLACLMIDVDHFKPVNDRLGHHAGDRLLAQVAHAVQATLRQSDVLARFGGDEFIVALPETSPAQAELVAEKLRQIALIPQEAGTQAHGLPAVTLSVGVGSLGQQTTHAQEILEAADRSLYAFKQRRHAPASLPHDRSLVEAKAWDPSQSRA